MFLDDTACNLASLNLLTLPRRRQTRRASTSSGYRARRAAVDHRARNLGADGAVPVASEIAQLSYEYRTLGLGYANIGGLLMSSGIPYDSARGPRDLRRAHRDHDRRLLCDLGRDGGAARRLPGLQEEPRAHAARDPQPSPRRAWRDRPATRRSRRRRCRSTTRLPRPPSQALIRRAPSRRPGTTRSRSASSTATATRRRP